MECRNNVLSQRVAALVAKQFPALRKLRISAAQPCMIRQSVSPNKGGKVYEYKVTRWMWELKRQVGENVLVQLAKPVKKWKDIEIAAVYRVPESECKKRKSAIKYDSWKPKKSGSWMDSYLVWKLEG